LFVALLSQTQRDAAPLQGANVGASGYIVVLILIVGIFVSQVMVCPTRLAPLFAIMQPIKSINIRTFDAVVYKALKIASVTARANILRPLVILMLNVCPIKHNLQYTPCGVLANVGHVMPWLLRDIQGISTNESAHASSYLVHIRVHIRHTLQATKADCIRSGIMPEPILKHDRLGTRLLLTKF